VAFLHGCHLSPALEHGPLAHAPGLHCLDRHRVGQNETWNVLDAGDGFRPADADIRDIAVHRTLTTETVWIAGWSRLYTSIAGSAVTEVGNTGDCRHETASRMLIDPQNDIWYGALDEVLGLAPEGGGGRAILVPDGLCRHRPGGAWTQFSDGLGFQVNDLALDGAGRLWAALSGRAAVHDQGTWCFYRKQDGTLFNDNVQAVSTAGEAVWFGHGGAPRLRFHSPNWSRVSAQQLFGSSAPFAVVLHAGGKIRAAVGNRVASATGDAWSSVALTTTSPVSALGLDGAGQVCAGTAAGEIYVQTSPAVFSPLSGPGIPAGGIRAIASDGQGRLWAATPNGLALRGNGYWLPFTKDDSGLGTNDLRSLAVDAQDRLWIASDRGIRVLEITATGASVWSSFDATTGLPADDVRGLAVGQGVLWAATAAGAAMWNGTAWSVHDAASGALPGDDALAVAVDGAGRVWVGTANGLARKEGTQWTHFHVTGSTLSNDRVTALAASDTQLWVASGTVLARRDEIIGPIGFAPPVISSFTPASGAPGAQVTINGTGFDTRGSSYNYVTIGETDIGGTGFPARAATATSAPFTLIAPPPLAFIRTPEEDEVFLEGSRVDLEGGSITADGAPGTFDWELNGAAVDGTDPEAYVVLDIAGAHTIRLRVTDAAGEASEWVERHIEVIADYDRDGLPNDYEREHGFDPLFFADAAEDADGDGLSNLGEYQHGTDPRNPDTDGDGWTDGAEVEQQTSPLHASDSPSLTPVLLAGAERLGFTVEEGGPAPEPTRFWITNGGGGLTWSAAADARWVTLSPLAGTAPAEIEIGVEPAGLKVGRHAATVTVTARGAAESPQAIAVELKVRERRDGPELPSFVRGDCDADGRVSGIVSDAVVILAYNFLGGAEPPCLAACDANGDGRVSGGVTDAVYLLNFNFLGGPPPAAPFPACGTHPKVDRSSCGRFEACE